MPKTIHIVGLGTEKSSTLPETLTPLLGSVQEVYLKYSGPDILAQLPASVKSVRPTLNPVDGLLDGYRTLAADVVRAAPVAYLVPGNPLIDEAGLPAIQQAASGAGITVEIHPAPDRLSHTLKTLRLAPGAGLQLVDATILCSRHYPPLEPDRAALITGLYHPDLLERLKESLSVVYRSPVNVTAVTPAGVVQTTLLKVDRAATDIYIPPQTAATGLTAFQDTIAHLRAPNGCPWDKEQTHRSLRPYLLEETYEVLAALDAGNSAELANELGDLLLQIALHAQIAAEAGHFTMTGIIYNINQKIIRRHPHVYGDTVVSSSDDVKANWAAIKAREKAEEGAAESPASVLDGVPQALPALAQALDISQKAVDVGFEWATIDGVLDKLAEEAREITAATTPDETESEVGDLLFVMVNLARKLKVDPESALRASNARFTRRFQKLESLARDNNLRLTDLEVAAWKDLWNQAKAAVAHLE